MLANIIHHHEHTEREANMYREITEQRCRYVVWPAIMHQHPPTGISQAHKQIIRHAKEAGQPMVLVMEDDVKFTSHGAFDRFVQNIPASFDLYLGGISFGDIDKNGKTQLFSGTHLYICHQRFYDTFLAADERKDIDQALWYKGEFIVCQPIAAIQYPGYSYQKKAVVDYSENFKKYLV